MVVCAPQGSGIAGRSSAVVSCSLHWGRPATHATDRGTTPLAACAGRRPLIEPAMTGRTRPVLLEAHPPGHPVRGLVSFFRRLPGDGRIGAFGAILPGLRQRLVPG